MTAQTLLAQLYAATRKGTMPADGNSVKSAYGPEFQAAFGELVAKGYIEQGGPVGTITLSYSGRRAAES